MHPKAPPKCCICCNVKIGTAIIATLFILFGIGGVISWSYALAHPVNMNDVILDSPGNDSQPIFDYNGYSASSKLLSMFLCVFISLIGCLGVVGVVKGNWCHLCPLMILQLFIILRTLISLCSIMFTWSSIRYAIAMCPKLPKDVGQWLLSLKDYQLALVVYGTFLVALAIKIYLFAVVHKCYNHIKLERCRNDVETGCSKMDEVAAALPDYSDIHKFPLVNGNEDEVKPPPYKAA